MNPGKLSRTGNSEPVQRSGIYLGANSNVPSISCAAALFIMPNTHRRRDSSQSAVELSRVGGVNAPVGSRDPVYNFPCC